MTAPTRQNFLELYRSQLQPELRGLEQKRLEVVRHMQIVGGVLAVCVVGVMFASIRAFGFHPAPLVFTAMFAAMGWYGAQYLLTRQYTRDFKARVISRVVKHFGEDFSYMPTGGVSWYDYDASHLFKRDLDKFHTEDHVRGRVGDVNIEFSELLAQYSTGSGKNRKTHTVFRGLWFVADFNKHFQHRTLVYPEMGMVANWGLGVEVNNRYTPPVYSGFELVKLEDPAFEKLFMVRAEDQIEARYILSTSLMARLTAFRQKTGREVYVAFSAGQVHVAISTPKNLLEPPVWRSLLDLGLMNEYLEDIEMALGIVKDLDLNTHVWSKAVPQQGAPARVQPAPGTPVSPTTPVLEPTENALKPRVMEVEQNGLTKAVKLGRG